MIPREKERDEIERELEKIMKTSTLKWSTEKSRCRIKNPRPARGGAS